MQHFAPLLVVQTGPARHDVHLHQVSQQRVDVEIIESGKAPRPGSSGSRRSCAPSPPGWFRRSRQRSPPPDRTSPRKPKSAADERLVRCEVSSPPTTDCSAERPVTRATTAAEMLRRLRSKSAHWRRKRLLSGRTRRSRPRKERSRTIGRCRSRPRCRHLHRRWPNRNGPRSPYAPEAGRGSWSALDLFPREVAQRVVRRASLAEINQVLAVVVTVKQTHATCIAGGNPSRISSMIARALKPLVSASSEYSRNPATKQ